MKYASSLSIPLEIVEMELPEKSCKKNKCISCPKRVNKLCQPCNMTKKSNELSYCYPSVSCPRAPKPIRFLCCCNHCCKSQRAKQRRKCTQTDAQSTAEKTTQLPKDSPQVVDEEITVAKTVSITTLMRNDKEVERTESIIKIESHVKSPAKQTEDSQLDSRKKEQERVRYGSESKNGNRSPKDVNTRQGKKSLNPKQVIADSRTIAKQKQKNLIAKKVDSKNVVKNEKTVVHSFISLSNDSNTEIFINRNDKQVECHMLPVCCYCGKKNTKPAGTKKSSVEIKGARNGSPKEVNTRQSKKSLGPKQVSATSSNIPSREQTKMNVVKADGSDSETEMSVVASITTFESESNTETIAKVETANSTPTKNSSGLRSDAIKGSSYQPKSKIANRSQTEDNTGRSKRSLASKQLKADSRNIPKQPQKNLSGKKADWSDSEIEMAVVESIMIFEPEGDTDTEIFTKFETDKSSFQSVAKNKQISSKGENRKVSVTNTSYKKFGDYSADSDSSIEIKRGCKNICINKVENNEKDCRKTEQVCKTGVPIDCKPNNHTSTLLCDQEIIKDEEIVCEPLVCEENIEWQMQPVCCNCGRLLSCVYPCPHVCPQSMYNWMPCRIYKCRRC